MLVLNALRDAGPEILQEHDIYIHSAAYERMKSSSSVSLTEIKDSFQKHQIHIYVVYAVNKCVYVCLLVHLHDLLVCIFFTK